MSKASYKSKKGESSSQYRQCVSPCPRFITSGDTHSLCVICLGVKHAESLLRKEAIEVVPPLDRESGFYSRYFVVPKKNGGATSNLRSAATEPLSQAPEVQNAYCKTGRVSDQIRGLVRHDRSKRCFFPYIHPSQFLRFAFRGKAYQYRVLPFGLTLSP